MKKNFAVSIALSMLLLGTSTFADNLSCKTIAEGIINARVFNSEFEKINFNGGIDYVGLELPESTEQINGGYDGEGGCNEQTLGKLTITCQGNTANATFDGNELKNIPDAYDTNTQTMYYKKAKLDGEDFYSKGNRTLEACTIANNSTKETATTTEIITQETITAPSTQVISAKQFKQLKNAPLFAMVEHFGYNWKKDRKNIAQQFGIKNYKGTAKQNMLIKQKLLEKLSTK